MVNPIAFTGLPELKENHRSSVQGSVSQNVKNAGFRGIYVQAQAQVHMGPVVCLHQVLGPEVWLNR